MGRLAGAAGGGAVEGETGDRGGRGGDRQKDVTIDRVVVEYWFGWMKERMILGRVDRREGGQACGGCVECFLSGWQD